MTAEGAGAGVGSDFLQLDATPVRARGLTTWLTGALRAAIVDGQLATGTRLPATRTLAGDLGVARGVVVGAYQRLGDEGLLDARTRVGTVVMPLTAPPARPPARAADHDAADTVPRLPVPTSRRLAPAELDLSPGVPDLTAFPRAAWLRAERAVLDRVTASDLGYGDPRGSAALRTELAGWLARTRGVRADPDDIIVVAEVAQSLALLAQTLRGSGADAVAVEDPGSRGARDELSHWGLRPRPVPVDEQEMQVDELARSGLQV